MKKRMKIAGIDVGGTHADGAVVAGDRVLAAAKKRVDGELSGVILALLAELQEALKKQGEGGIDRIHLSSTLCTNAIVTGNLAPVGMLIQAGPGMNPDFLDCGEYRRFLDGAVDHRGTLLKSPDPQLVTAALAEFEAAGIDSVGIVTKFSHRNPQPEQALARQAADFPYLTCGHTLAGLPNFPRRVYTTWLNAGLRSRFADFAAAVREGVAALGLDAPISVLKADGGTMPLAAAESTPCQSIHSGPSASVMGALALTPREGDFVVLDIGGTTTDIGLFAGGLPLMEASGATVMGRPTLIRALCTRSVGLGGDSLVQWQEGRFVIGPQRHGTPAAFGGSADGATPSDAMVLLGGFEDSGDKESAAAALKRLRPDTPLQETASELLAAFAAAIHHATEAMIEEVFARPVYTVAALLARKRLAPQEIIAVGGPAPALREVLAETFQLPCTVPQESGVANAIGAARTRPTLAASLYADSGDGTLSIPELGLHEEIGRSFDMEDAEQRLTEALGELADGADGAENQPPIDFIEREEMNTVRGFSASGKIISLKAQLRPGLQEVNQ